MVAQHISNQKMSHIYRLQIHTFANQKKYIIYLFIFNFCGASKFATITRLHEKFQMIIQLIVQFKKTGQALYGLLFGLYMWHSKM